MTANAGGICPAAAVSTGRTTVGGGFLIYLSSALRSMIVLEHAKERTAPGATNYATATLQGRF